MHPSVLKLDKSSTHMDCVQHGLSVPFLPDLDPPARAAVPTSLQNSSNRARRSLVDATAPKRASPSSFGSSRSHRLNAVTCSHIPGLCVTDRAHGALNPGWMQNRGNQQ